MKNLVAVVFVSIFLMITITAAHAQLRPALLGGAHVSSVMGDSHPGWDTMSYSYSQRRGIHLGLQLDIPLSAYSRFHLQPAMIFSNKGRKLSTRYDTAFSDVSNVQAQQFINYMEMPVNLVYKMSIGKKTNIILGAGPYVSFLYNGRESRDIHFKSGQVSSMENTDLKRADLNGHYENFDYGVNGLLGVEFGRIFLTANYSQGFKDFYQPNNALGAFKHRVMGATAGIYLGKLQSKKAKDRDRDGDGIPDADDDCPKVKGTLSGKGCPDQDGDGIPDIHDKCPSLPGNAKNKGCPGKDSDGDGVPDDEDKCPDQKGSKENEGCPVIEETIVREVQIRAGRIQFEYSSSVLTARSKNALEGIVNILKENPEFILTIEGYTSSDGTGYNHMRLSQARAESVKKYLQSKGIAGKRIKTIGRGTANPLNDNATEQERELNRRVELKLSNHQ